MNPLRYSSASGSEEPFSLWLDPPPPWEMAARPHSWPTSIYDPQLPQAVSNYSNGALWETALAGSIALTIISGIVITASIMNNNYFFLLPPAIVLEALSISLAVYSGKRIYEKPGQEYVRQDEPPAQREIKPPTKEELAQKRRDHERREREELEGALHRYEQQLENCMRGEIELHKIIMNDLGIPSEPRALVGMEDDGPQEEGRDELLLNAKLLDTLTARQDQVHQRLVRARLEHEWLDVLDESLSLTSIQLGKLAMIDAEWQDLVSKRVSERNPNQINKLNGRISDLKLKRNQLFKTSEADLKWIEDKKKSEKSKDRKREIGEP